jgi:hypothetical protein
MAPADDRWRIGSGMLFKAARQPAVQLDFGKQPAAGDFGAGDDALGDQFVELALL